MQSSTKNKIIKSFSQIVNMNVGFFGIQYSFGLQQTAVNPIFSFLGAHHEELPLLNLAGPVTGLLVQPIIGAISDNTWSEKWGRRKPFFLMGAFLGSLCLFLFPFSPSLWFAVGLLWILDAANNTAMEPYRAFIGDQLVESQQTFGFQMQSLFVGAGITLANFSLFLFQDWFGGTETSALCDVAETNSIPVWIYYSFFIGGIASIATILWSVIKTPEYPPSDQELAKMNAEKASRSGMESIVHPIKEIFAAIKDMPNLMKQLAAVYFFQWFALFVYWQFLAPLIKRTIYPVSAEDESRFENIVTLCRSGSTVSDADMDFAGKVQQLTELAVSQTGLMNGTYNFVTMIVALMLVPFASRFGSKNVYWISLLLTGIALLSLPYIHHPYWILLPMILFGIGWACMMGIPYSLVSQVIPDDKRGVYMGIVNMMIVIPMLIQTISFGFIYKNILGSSPINAMLFAGVSFIIAALLVIPMKVEKNA